MISNLKSESRNCTGWDPIRKDDPCVTRRHSAFDLIFRISVLRFEILRFQNSPVLSSQVCDHLRPSVANSSTTQSCALCAQEDLFDVEFAAKAEKHRVVDPVLLSQTLQRCTFNLQN